VYRWDTRPYEEIFINGFQTWPQGETLYYIYYDLLNFINNGGAPLYSNMTSSRTHVFVSTTICESWEPKPYSEVPRTHVFVSTTICESWEPKPYSEVLIQRSSIQLYRYEIYVPGGILVQKAFGNRYKYPLQTEVSFVGGIAPEYIRSYIIVIVTRVVSYKVKINRQSID